MTLKSILFSLALASYAAAIPFPGSSKTFSCFQSVEKPYRSPQDRLIAVYNKYGSTAPAGLQAAAANGTGSATTTPVPADFDREYLTPVTIGSSTLNLDFDTGSADL